MPKKRKSRDQDGIYRRPDSQSWWASYIDAGGKRTRRSTGTANRRDAEAILAKWKLENYRAQQWEEQPSRTFDELMLPYLKYALREKRQNPSGIRAAARQLHRAFTGVDLQAISDVDVRRYAEARRQQGAAASTVNKEVGLLSAAIGHANRQWGWRLQNPAKGCRLREPEGRVRWLTRAQAMRLTEEARREPRTPHLADLVQLALHTGMRRGELLGLEWERVDLQQRLIYLEGIHTKAGRRRSVPLNAAAYAAILGRARFRAEHAPGTRWVFCRRNGLRIGDVKHGFASACARAGIEDFRFHDLRHCCAAWLVQAGAPLAQVRDLLGHSTIKMTERYAHLAPENVRLAVGLLDAESRLSHVDESTPRESLDVVA
ncbi:MAG: site-specific integrase [Thiohalocapsa sp.]|nr:site-specific integrase [Thiohalocapsa sp.]MCF7991105.1 site-specific integrase [Thiohalocapsa sp.]